MGDHAVAPYAAVSAHSRCCATRLTFGTAAPQQAGVALDKAVEWAAIPTYSEL